MEFTSMNKWINEWSDKVYQIEVTMIQMLGSLAWGPMTQRVDNILKIFALSLLTWKDWIHKKMTFLASDTKNPAKIKYVSLNKNEI